MKHWQSILIGVLTFVILVLIMRDCARPGEEREKEREEQHKTEVAILKSEKAQIQSTQDSTVKRYKDKVNSDSLNLARQDSKIKVLQTKLANQRPIVIEKIQADTAVLSYVNTLEEVVGELQGQVDTLKSQAEFNRSVTSDLIVNEMVEDKVEQQMMVEYERRVSELSKQVKKKSVGARLWKGVSTVLGVVIVTEIVRQAVKRDDD